MLQYWCLAPICVYVMGLLMRSLLPHHDEFALPAFRGVLGYFQFLEMPSDSPWSTLLRIDLEHTMVHHLHRSSSALCDRTVMPRAGRNAYGLKSLAPVPNPAHASRARCSRIIFISSRVRLSRGCGDLPMFSSFPCRSSFFGHGHRFLAIRVRRDDNDTNDK